MRRAVGACAVSVVVVLGLGAFVDVAVAAPSTPLTKDQYVAAYNALCDDGITKVEDAINALPRDHDNDQVANAIVPIYQQRLDDSRELVPPEQDRKQVKKLLAAQQTAIDSLKDDSEVLVSGGSAADAFTNGVGKHADKLAKRYGLESGNCLEHAGPGAGNTGPQDTAPCPGGPCAAGNPPAPGSPLPPGVTAPPPPPSSGSGGLPGATPAAQWVTAVCAAETSLHGTLQGELDAIKSKADAASQKQGFVDFISGLPAQLKTLERAIKQSGAPNVTNGKKIAKTYISTLNAILKKLPSLKSQAEALPTSSQQALQSAGMAIGQAIDAIKQKGDSKVSSLDSSGTLAPNLGTCGGTFPL